MVGPVVRENSRIVLRTFSKAKDTFMTSPIKELIQPQHRRNTHRTTHTTTHTHKRTHILKKGTVSMWLRRVQERRLPSCCPSLCISTIRPTCSRMTNSAYDDATKDVVAFSEEEFFCDLAHVAAVD